MMEPLGRGLSEAEIRSAESELGTRLPDDYRQFIKNYNGGIPRHRHYRIKLYDDVAWTQNLVLYSLKNVDDAQGVSVVEDTYREFRSIVPPCALVIGAFEGGINVVLFTGGSREGQVWLKSTEEPIGGATVKEADPESGLYFAASSFGEFLKNLQHDDPGDVKWVP